MEFFPNSIIMLIAEFAMLFPANNFAYFEGFMLSYMLLGKTRKCVTNVAEVCFWVDKHIASWERFLSEYNWSSFDIQEKLLSIIKEKLSKSMLIHGAYLAVVDTTLVGKVKGKMPGVQKWHDSSGNPDRGHKILGHHWAIVGLIGCGFIGGKVIQICFPLLATIISGKKNPVGFIVSETGQAEPMTFWDSVCPLVVKLVHMLGKPVRVVADAYFAKAPFITRMLADGIHVVTRMRHDAVAWDDPAPLPEGKKRRGRKSKNPPKGKSWKIADLLKVFPLEAVSATIYGKIKKMQVVSRDMWIRGVESQKVRVVVVKGSGKAFILMSTDLTLNAAQIIEIYAARFSIETSIRDLKQNFGMGDYQCTSHKGILRYVGLALIGFCLWKLALLGEDSELIEDKKAPASFARVSRTVRGKVIQGLIRKSAQNGNFQNTTTLPYEVSRMIV